MFRGTALGSMTLEEVAGKAKAMGIEPIAYIRLLLESAAR